MQCLCNVCILALCRPGRVFRVSTRKHGDKHDAGSSLFLDSADSFSFSVELAGSYPAAVQSCVCAQKHAFQKLHMIKTAHDLLCICWFMRIPNVVTGRVPRCPKRGRMQREFPP